MPADHPILHSHYDIKQRGVYAAGTRGLRRDERPGFEGITIDGRLAVLYSRFDLGNGWEQFPHPYSYGLKDQSAMQVGTNMLVYATTH